MTFLIRVGLCAARASHPRHEARWSSHLSERHSLRRLALRYSVAMTYLAGKDRYLRWRFA